MGEFSREIYTFLVYVGAAGYSLGKTNLIGKIFDEIKSIENVYLPFVANVKEDFMYHINLLEGKTFKRYRCRNCKTIFIVGDCGKLSNHRSKQKEVNAGGMRC